ncbi:MAG: RNA polymerase sigma factor [Acidobacteria bacterium]|nr:RNA polymerase sigma factor [Acidobacteriota bacterium]
MFYEALFFPDLLAKNPPACAEPNFGMDEDSFRVFYQANAPTLQGYIRKTCGNAALAEDFLQETFYRFLRSDLPKMEPPQMKAYLFKTATTIMIDHWRREKREKFWRDLWKPVEARHSEQRDDVTRALLKLKPAERALLWLAYVEGFSHSEIASTLGFKEKGIRVLLFRARRKLARIMGRQAGNNGVTL